MMGSVKSALCLFDVASLLLGQVHEVDGTIMRNDSQSVVFEIETDSLHFLVHLNLCET